MTESLLVTVVVLPVILVNFLWEKIDEILHKFHITFIFIEVG